MEVDDMDAIFSLKDELADAISTTKEGRPVCRKEELPNKISDEKLTETLQAIQTIEIEPIDDPLALKTTDFRIIIPPKEKDAKLIENFIAQDDRVIENEAKDRVEKTYQDRQHVKELRDKVISRPDVIVAYFQEKIDKYKVFIRENFPDAAPMLQKLDALKQYFSNPETSSSKWAISNYETVIYCGMNTNTKFESYLDTFILGSPPPKYFNILFKELGDYGNFVVPKDDNLNYNSYFKSERRLADAATFEEAVDLLSSLLQGVTLTNDNIITITSLLVLANMPIATMQAAKRSITQSKQVVLTLVSNYTKNAVQAIPQEVVDIVENQGNWKKVKLQQQLKSLMQKYQSQPAVVKYLRDGIYIRFQKGTMSPKPRSRKLAKAAIAQEKENQ